MKQHISLALLFACTLCTVPTAQEPQATEEKPLDSSLEERVQVQLVEVKVRVTDKKGNAVTDIRPEEVRVLENGEKQKLAYFEALANRVLVAGKEDQTSPASLFDASGEMTTSQADVVLPPKPVRRIFFVFDPRNSRIPSRDGWKTAAVAWARTNLTPGDQAGVVLIRTYPEWVLQPTANKDAVVSTLEAIDLYTNIPNRNRANEMTDFMHNLESLCLDSASERLADDKTDPTSSLGRDQIGCAYEMSRPMAFEWSEQSKETLDVLEYLSGQLGAIPGQKIVVLFSEGIIDDPAQVLLNAWLSVFPFSQVDTQAMMTRLSRNTLHDVSTLHERAAAADVAFFTLDTRSRAGGGNATDLERTSASREGNLGFSPQREMYEATRSTLAGLANATGGGSYYGADELESKIEKAAGSFYGIYTVGYYRSQPWRPRGKVNIKIDRKKLVLDYDKKPKRRVHIPDLAQLELVVGRPTVTAGDRQLLPVALLTPINQLPLRPGAGGRGCEVAVFVQAVRPDGEVIAESYEIETIVLNKDELQAVKDKQWSHMVELAVPQGPMRLRARISDDRLELLGDRSIDLTVELGNVRGGLVAQADDPS